MLGLVEPNSNGIGGDLFAIVYEAKTGKLYGLNASGWAPTGMTIDFLRAKGETKMPHRGHSLGHRARRSRRMGCAAQTLRPLAALPPACTGDLLRGGRLSGD